MTSPVIVSKMNPSPRQQVNGSISGTFTAATDVNTTANAVMGAGILTLTLGFRPKSIKMINVTDQIRLEWYEGMTATSHLETAANGTMSLETDSVITVTGNTGSGGSNGGGGSADGAGGCTVVVLTTDIIITDNDLTIFTIEG